MLLEEAEEGFAAADLLGARHDAEMLWGEEQHRRQPSYTRRSCQLLRSNAHVCTVDLARLIARYVALATLAYARQAVTALPLDRVCLSRVK